MGLFNLFKGSNAPQKRSVQRAEPEQTVDTKSRNHDACPNCGVIFSPAPKRKKVCPACKQEVFVRTKQQLFNSDLLLEEDALAADFYEQLMFLGATLDDYKKMGAVLAAKWGFKPKSYDVVWGVSNQLVTRPVGSDVYDKVSAMLYNAKSVGFAQALYQANRGKDPSSYKRSVNNYDVQLAQHSGLPLKGFTIETQGCCNECSKYQGKVYTAEKLKSQPLLPLKDCTSKLKPTDKFSWCLCMYSPIYR